jgi:hypothetical protein
VSGGSKPITGAEKDVAWKLAQKHSLLFLEQGTQTFDDALFAFCADMLQAFGEDGQRSRWLVECKHVPWGQVIDAAHAAEHGLDAAIDAARSKAG